MKGKKIVALFLAFAVILTMTPVQAEAKTKAKISKVAIKNECYGKKLYLAKGKKVKLQTEVVASPNKKANKQVTFKSKNSKIAKIDKKGNVTAKKTGSTKITATSKVNKKKKATVTVQVTEPVKTIVLNKANMSLEEGKSEILKVTITPSTKVCTYVKWTSSNDKVATVDAKGNVKAIAAGTATIKATSVDGTKKSAACVVSVKKPVTTDKNDVSDKETTNTNATKIDASITNMSYIYDDRYGYSDYIEITFDRDVNLKKEDFKVTHKEYGKNRERKEAIEGVEKCSGNKYRIKVNECVHGSTYKVIVGGITGKNEISKMSVREDETKVETIYRNASDVVVFLLGHTGGDIPIVDFQVEGCPPGISVMHGTGPYLQGRGTGTNIGGKPMVVRATDAVGRVYTYQYYYKFVGADELYIVKSEDEINGPVHLTGDDNYIKRIYVLGGSEKYRLELLGESKELFTVGDTMDIHSKESLAPGKYKITYKVIDSEDENLSITDSYSFEVVKSHTLTIMTEDAYGITVNDSVTGETVFYADSEHYDNADRVDLNLKEGKSYDIYAYDSFMMEEYLIRKGLVMDDDKTIVQKNDTVQLKTKVTGMKDSTILKYEFENENGAKKTIISRDNEHDFGLRKGKYKVSVWYTNQWISSQELHKTYEVNMTDDKVLNVDMTGAKELKPYVVKKMNGPGECEVETKEKILTYAEWREGYVYVEFIPSETGSYNIYQGFDDDEQYNTKGILCDNKGNRLKDDDTSDGFRYYNCQLTAGQTYYIGVNYCIDPVKVVIEKTK